MTTVQLSIRGLPEWLVRQYLTEMGALADTNEPEASRMIANGWSVSWSSQKVQIPGSSKLGLTQFDMEFRGGADAVADAHERFMKKAQRGGG